MWASAVNRNNYLLNRIGYNHVQNVSNSQFLLYFDYYYIFFLSFYISIRFPLFCRFQTTKSWPYKFDEDARPQRVLLFLPKLIYIIFRSHFEQKSPVNKSECDLVTVVLKLFVS